MRATDEMKAQYEAKLKEKEETLEFYRPYFDSSNLYHKELDKAMEKLERLESVFHRVFDK